VNDLDVNKLYSLYKKNVNLTEELKKKKRYYRNVFQNDFSLKFHSQGKTYTISVLSKNLDIIRNV
jgi:hypothetical protein